MKKLIIIVSLFLLGTTGLIAQTELPPFWQEIQNFKKQDSLHFPAKDQVLFVGSSSFAMWTDVQNYFPDYKIINRGFGGSSLPDVIRYVNDIIIPYQPKQIVIYCGENDLAASDTVTSEMVLDRFKVLFFLIRKQLPKVPIVFISIKPSPSRQHLMPKMEAANKMIKKFLKKERRTAFVDVYHRMLKPDGTPMDDIFREDKLHMTAKGYAIWQKAIKPYLKK
ncbi:MAG TPA: GDSL-type esterase/lipase family protein [Chitinophagaceae bacterium]|nr:GDSL-type esterase/lipase family protein [Chitinophagaceae bacterium]